MKRLFAVAVLGALAFTSPVHSKTMKATYSCKLENGASLGFAKGHIIRKDGVKKAKVINGAVSYRSSPSRKYIFFALGGMYHTANKKNVSLTAEGKVKNTHFLIKHKCDVNKVKAAVVGN